MAERIQKILSRRGVASRRQAEALLASGRVTVNGQVAKLGDVADDGRDEIALDGRIVASGGPKCYLMLHKPAGYVTTLSDEKGRKTVAQLVADCGQRVYPVGRLDLNSEGLLLMTNDGALANRLMHPRGEIKKRYLVTVRGFQAPQLEALTKPIEIDGRLTRPAQVKLLRSLADSALLEFILFDGRNRQIRRLCEREGLTVLRLVRVQEGPLSLGSLPRGSWRPLTFEELQALEQALNWKFLQDP